jgi:putative oxidoreductase
MSSALPERASTEDPDSTRAFDDPQRTTTLRPFGVSPVSESEWEDPEESRPPRARHVVDRWDGALGLFLLRIVVAAIFAIRGLQKVQHLDVTRAQFEQVGIPYADTMAFVVGVCEVAIAVALVFGILMRVVGIGIAVIAIGALVYVKWRTGAVFTDGQPGFAGELELLLAAVGLTFAGLGGGGWTVDRRFRRR